MQYSNSDRTPNIFYASRKAGHRKFYEDINGALNYHLFKHSTLVAAMANGATSHPTIGSKIGCNIAVDTALKRIKDLGSISFKEMLDSEKWIVALFWAS